MTASWPTLKIRDVGKNVSEGIEPRGPIAVRRNDRIGATSSFTIASALDFPHPDPNVRYQDIPIAIFLRRRGRHTTRKWQKLPAVCEAKPRLFGPPSPGRTPP